MRSLIVVAVLVGPLSAGAQLRTHESYSVAREHVARAVAASLNAAIAEQQVSLPAEVVAKEPTPALEVRSAKLLSGRGEDTARQVAVKLTCRTAGVCLPFYAVVHWPDGRKLPGGAEFRATVMAGRSLKVKAPKVLRAGSRAMLLLDDGQMRMEVPVIALESASVGQKIRVTSLDRKRSYTGEVLTAGLLKGAF